MPAGPTGLHGAVDEQSVVVGWTGPRHPRGRLARCATIALYGCYRREEADGGEPKSAMLSSGRVVGYDEIATIRPRRPAPATVQGTSVTWVDRRALSVGRRYVYVVTAEDALGRSSGPSERLVVPYLAAPKAPRALRAAPGDRRISLTWEPPAEMIGRLARPGRVSATWCCAARERRARSPRSRPRPVDGTSFTDDGRRQRHRLSLRGARGARGSGGQRHR